MQLASSTAPAAHLRVETYRLASGTTCQLSSVRGCTCRSNLPKPCHPRESVEVPVRPKTWVAVQVPLFGQCAPPAGGKRSVTSLHNFPPLIV